MAICCALMFSAGCQRRAYTDLYAENMAGEVRELENRIYEYDSAYQALEEELAVRQSENATLHEKLLAMESNPPKASGSGRSLFKGFQGSNAEPSTSGSKNYQESRPAPLTPSFQVNPTPDPLSNSAPTSPPKSSANSPAPSVNNLPNSPAKSSEPKAKGKNAENELKPPSVELGTPGSMTLPPSSVPQQNLPVFPVPDTKPNSNNDSLLPPPIKSSSTPPVTSLPKSNDASSIANGRIELPSSIQSASFVQTISSPSIATPRDTKVIEIAFHPTLCRGQNIDSKEGDDGLYFVLQPRNASGETIDKPASLTIVAFDPNRPEGQSKIGRWTLTMEEVEATLEPIGISHGYHIPLPWQEAKPLGDVVQVFVRYEMADGRRLVNDRRVQLHIPTTGSATWTPRVSKP